MGKGTGKNGLNVKAEQLNPGFLFYTMGIRKNWGGIQVGIVKFNNIYYKK